ncbi:tRNA A37 threonylcarbamoyladenosine dehydratase [Caldanaerobius fijiensis DSM 17918]|uniref:tRNA A37 threonylcarbamoyladenosine dehydratase n=1 Tax=Caldanaerobius fijiensis DSM 17918 TaxID=1121256 RepID=A0A1M4TZ20_9THEO|nr:tRNA threonylcarbamoyladenosine dehydratase [Caldanaerobius fijiensis]SHE49772.1 tRNA A37 threonylcarbamoyladenosine dehydratase [Caldanaerobius fijiensis DSM 17918]
MKQHAFSRTELLLGSEAMEKLYRSTVAVFGIGGVGSYVVEALARSGVGKLVLIDDDDVCITNINRQIHATTKTIGQPKVQVMAQRVMDINPRAEVVTFKEFYLPDNAERMISTDYDYVVDAIDTVTAKIDLVVRCKNLGIPIISAMGAGNKLDPTKLKVADIYETKICPLAKIMRYELRKRNIKSLKVVYSEETPIKPRLSEVATCKNNCVCPDKSKGRCALRRQIPGSVSFVPPVMGFIIAGEVIKDLIDYKKRGEML